MDKKLGISILVVCAIVSASMFAGCVEEETPVSSPTISPGTRNGGDEGTKPTLTPSPTLIPSSTPAATLIFEGASPGSNKLNLVHFGGDTIVDAFKGDAPYWNSLEIWIDDVIFEGTIKLNSAPVITGDFAPGDELELFLDQELTDCYISAIYTPTGDILQRAAVGTPSSTPVIPITSDGAGQSKPQPRPTQIPEAPSTSLTLENAVAGSSEITLIHQGGDTIVDAFKGNPPYWNSLEVKINGALYIDTLKLNGATISAGDFKAGDELEFFLDQELTEGDRITVIYTPTGEILMSVKTIG